MLRQHSDRVEYVTDVQSAGDAINGMMFENESDEVIYQPREDDIEAVFVEWTRSLKRAVIAAPEKELAIFIDEASFYNLTTPTFQWLAKCSLRDYTHIIITAHQPKDIPTNIRAIADHWFIFYTTQETDLAKIAEKSPEAAKTAKTLRERAYVHWDDTKANLAINPVASSWFIALQTRPNAQVIVVAPESTTVRTTLFDQE